MSYNYQTYLKETIVFQTVSTSTVDERGLYNSNWQNDITTVCRVVPKINDELENDKELIVEELDVYVPASVNIKTSHRAVYDSKYYDVLGVTTKKNRFSEGVIKHLTMRRSA